MKTTIWKKSKWLLFPSMHDCFLPCMIIVSFHAWLFSSIHDYCFLLCMWPQVIDLFPLKRRGSQGWQFLFLSRGVSHGVGRRTNQNKCRTKRCPRFVLFSCRRIHVTGTNIYIYTRTCVYMIIWRCSETYSWIYWRMKEMDIGQFFLSI